MFDLRAWQQQLEMNIANDAQKNQIWQQMKPLIANLLPLIESLQQNVEQRVKEQAQLQKPLEICCFASDPATMPLQFHSMLLEETQQRLLMRQENSEMMSALKKQLKKPTLQNQSSHIWLHGGICYGDEQQLREQTVQVIFSKGDEQHVVQGKYVQHKEPQLQAETFIEQVTRIGAKVPFIPNYYAARFYVLQLDREACMPLLEWTGIDRLDVEPFSHSVAQQVQFKRYEEPLWNVDTVVLNYCQGSRKPVANGLHERKFDYMLQQTEEVPTIAPIVPECAVIRAFTQSEEGRISLTIELPADLAVVTAYRIKPITNKTNVLHNESLAAMHSFAKEPSIADLHHILSNYSYFQPLQLSYAELEILAAQKGDLWRRDCLVLYVTGEKDMYTASRMHAVEQVIEQTFAYAACRVQWVGDVDES